MSRLALGLIAATVAALVLPGSTWWHRQWDEATQAEFVEKFYTIAFSKPLVQEIGWSYGVSDENTFIPSGGLLDGNLKPKPSYFALKKLIASWTTTGSGETDSRGELEITGFAGDYEIAVSAPGAATARARVHIDERQERALTIPATTP